MTKECSQCHILKEVSEFPPNIKVKNGIQPHCRPCGRIIWRKYYRRNRDKVQLKVKKWKEANEAQWLFLKEKHRSSPEEKVKNSARMKVNRAVKNGSILKNPCHCGERTVEGHHSDYSKPLKVEWLCKQHHEDIHHLIIK